MAGERNGNGTGAAWARHAMCVSALRQQIVDWWTSSPHACA